MLSCLQYCNILNLISRIASLDSYSYTVLLDTASSEKLF